MKIFLILYSFLTALYGQQEYNCTVTIDGLANTKGVLYIGWYNNATDFLKVEKAVYYQKAPVSNITSQSFLFKNIAAGNYAISLFLDEDGNGQLSTNIFGIPNERYAFSNNVKPAFRPATFSEAQFTVKSDKQIRISLK